MVRSHLECCVQFCIPQKRQESPRRSPVEGHKDDKGPGASPVQGKAERPRAVQPGEMKTEGESD